MGTTSSSTAMVSDTLHLISERLAQRHPHWRKDSSSKYTAKT